MGDVGRVFEDVRESVERSDIGKAAGAIGQGTKNIVTAPVDAGLDLVKGDTKSAGNRFTKALGSTADAATGYTSRVFAGDRAQAVLRRSGLSDAAGFNAGITQAATQGTVSNQYRNEGLRFLSQVAAVGGAQYAYNNPVIPTGSSEVPYVSGREIFSGIGQAASSNPWTTATAIGVTSSLSKGKTADAIEQATGLKLPDWMREILPNNPEDPSELSPWKNDNYTSGSQYTSSSNQKDFIMKALLYGGGAIVLILILKKVAKK